MIKLKNLIICSNESNDITTALNDSGYEIRTANCVESAVNAASANDGLLLIADSYPVAQIALSSDSIKKISEKGLRVIVEYPMLIGDRPTGEPYIAEYERMVVCNNKTTGLNENTIMTVNGCHILPSDAEDFELCMAKVAGYDKVEFGLPETVYPVMERYNENILVLNTSLSRFIKARYAPLEAWRRLWNNLIKWLCGVEVSLVCHSPISATFSKSDSLSPNAEQKAFDRGHKWLCNNIVAKQNGRITSQEGYRSTIDYCGIQKICDCLRSDCISETAMALVQKYGQTGDFSSKVMSESMMDTVWCWEEYTNNDSATEYYGLNNWYSGAKNFYGDDNARALLGSLMVRGETGNNKWDEPIFRCIIANLRTTSQKTGFRRDRIDAQKEGSLFEGEITAAQLRDDDENSLASYAPHFQCYLWACYLLAYQMSKDQLFLEIAEKGIINMMSRFPSGWKWTNSLSAEISRMLLPLSYLYRVKKTEENKKNLLLMCDEVIACMDECGAVRDKIGDPAKGLYPPPQSNEAYGTTEASLIQNNGDPATDLLYTANWSFLGLHEAACALKGEPEQEKVLNAENALAEFLCKIQIKSADERYLFLDGAWMRSFDFQKWEYWGSSSDVGWGAWCVESGWSNTWIITVMSLRCQNKSLFESICDVNSAPLINKLLKQMI